MKKIVILAAFGVAGLVNAKNSADKEILKVSNNETKSAYHPITLTSSCGYTQIIEVGPKDDQWCWTVDLNQMEEECAAPFENGDGDWARMW